MTSLSPKNQIPKILSSLANEWYHTRNSYVKKLDRINGKIQWTEESVSVLDNIHDTLLSQLPSYLEQVDLNAREHEFVIYD